jgi:hypothetical protein
MGCSFADKHGGDGGRCTGSRGFLSNREIQQLINEGGYKVVFNKTAMVKYMTYGANRDSWIAFDDKETIALKERFARGRCLGGTMIWSIDLTSSGMNSKPGSLREKSSEPLCDESWRDVRCTTKSIDSDWTAPVADRWTDLKADVAWCAAIKDWFTNKTSYERKEIPFSRAISQYMKYTDYWHCEAIDPYGTDCRPPDECRDSSRGSGAAMQHVLGSLSMIHRVSSDLMICWRLNTDYIRSRDS